MSQQVTVREKRITKDTPGTAQYRESIGQSKKRREESEQKKLLKEQGVGSTIPASRKQNTQSEQLDMNESSDEDFDETLAEIRAEEARVDALRAKLANRDGIRYKKLKTMDETELQRLWDKGKAKKADSKISASVASQPENPKVKSIGPSQRILTSSKSSSAGKDSSRKRKRASSPAHGTPKSQSTKHIPDKKSSSSRRESTNAKTRSADDSQSSSGSEAGSDPENDEDDSDSDMEDGVNDGNGSSKSRSGKGGRGKTSDFTGTVKKMIDYTTVRVCAKLTSSGMFIPPREYKLLVSKCWTRAAAEYGVDVGKTKYALQKRHKQAIRARVNSFRSRIRDRLKPAIASVYRLLAEGRTPDEAKDYIQSLFPHGYHTKIGARPGIGHFQHSFLEEAVFEAYYTGNNPVAIAYEKWFDPMPLEAIGFVCAIIRWVIQQHETGKYVKSKMSFEKLREYYDEVMESLRAFKTGKQSQRCVVVQSTLYVRSMERAGRSVLEVEPKPAETTLKEDDFAEDIPTAEELTLLARGASHGRPVPKNTGSHSKRLTASPTSQSDMPRSRTASQRPSSARSSPEGPHAADGRETRQRYSSVSLDHEESEDEHETTPTPTVRTRVAAEDDKVGEDEGEGHCDDTNSTSDSASETTSESEDEGSGSQKPPKKKQKGATTTKKSLGSQQPVKKKQKSATPSTFLEKLAGSSQKTDKLNPKAARLQGTLKLSGGISEKPKPRTSKAQ